MSIICGLLKGKKPGDEDGRQAAKARLQARRGKHRLDKASASAGQASPDDQKGQAVGNGQAALVVTEDPVTQRFEKQESFRKVATASSIHLGTRLMQQDACFVTATTSFWDGEYQMNTIGIVCDGMGGLDNGAEASQLVVETMLADIASIGQVSDPPGFFATEVAKLDALVTERFGINEAGTTLAVAVLSGDHLYWCSVGDSRIYLINEAGITQLTRDHNYQLVLEEKVGRGLIAAEAALNDPQRESLISFLGMGGVEVFDINQSPLAVKHGDTVLLCSDGLTKSLTDDEIKEVVMGNFGAVEEAARLLPIVAFDTGGTKDNTSVVIIQYLK